MNPYSSLFIILSLGFACGSGFNNKASSTASSIKRDATRGKLKKESTLPLSAKSQKFNKKYTLPTGLSGPSVHTLDSGAFGDATDATTEQSAEKLIPSDQMRIPKPLPPAEDVQLPKEGLEKNTKKQDNLEPENYQKQIKSLQAQLNVSRKDNFSIREKILTASAESAGMKCELERLQRQNEKLNQENKRLNTLLENQTRIKNGYDKSIHRYRIKEGSFLQEIVDLRKAVNSKQTVDAWKRVYYFRDFRKSSLKSWPNCMNCGVIYCAIWGFLLTPKFLI
jgi:hypothetical protein